MHKSRMAVLGAVAAFALLLVGGAGPAAAQTEGTPLTQVVKMTGKAKNSKKFTGTYAIDRFTSRGGKLYAVGTLKGKLKGRNIKRSGVRIPATLARHQAAGASQLPNPTAGACQILNLVLNPIDLNLLGLRVATSRIELLIEAIPGAGNLLGNLLCGITGILDPQAATPASTSQLAQVLNALLALVPRTA
jgi:hypothetical protein